MFFLGKKFQIRWSTAVLIAFLSCLLSWSSSREAAAQASAIQNVIVEKNRVIERFRPPLEMQQRVSLSVPLDRRSLVDLPARAAPLNSVQISGNSFLTLDQLQPLWADLLGRPTARSEIEELILEIERFYLESDVYARALVTAWQPETGSLTVEIFEGYLEEVTVESDLPDMTDRLRPYIRRMVSQVPLRVSRMERELLLIADLEGFAVDALLEQVPERVGAGRLTLVITPERYTLGTQLDNFTDDDTGPFQLTAYGSTHDLFGLFEQSILVGMVTPLSPRRFRLAQFSQDYPLSTSGLRFGYSLTQVASEPGGEAREIDLEVESSVGTLWFRYPFIRRIHHNLIGQLELSGQNDGVRIGGAHVVDDRKRWIGLTGTYDRILDKGMLLGRLTFKQGIDGLGATAADDLQTGRWKGRPNFRSLEAEAQFHHRLAEGWHLDVGSLGQLALNRLPSAARFSIGGDSIGRSFVAASLSADSGIATTLAVSHELEQSLPALEDFTAFAFADHAWLHNGMDDMEFGSAQLAGLGIGINWRNHVQVGLTTPAFKSDSIETFNTRAFVRLSYQF